MFAYNADRKVLRCDVSQYAGHVFALSGDPSSRSSFAQSSARWLFLPEVAPFVVSRLLCSLPADLIVSLSLLLWGVCEQGGGY